LRIAALYDVHGNLPALDAVLADIDADLILVGGDFVAGPWPAETLERLRGLDGDVRFIRGNADRELSEPSKPHEGLEWIRAQLSPEQLQFLDALPLTETLEVDGLGKVLFCHATPRSDDELLTRISPEERWQRALESVDAHVVVCGHTHVQFDRRIGDIRLVNAGSVGMPYEHEPGAYWVLLGPEVDLRRTEYKAGDIAGSGFPDQWPESGPEEATALFERVSSERA
jgi:putative phosphoesterase